MKEKIILETLRRLNDAIKSNPNALVVTNDGDVDPDTAYIELVRALLNL